MKSEKQENFVKEIHGTQASLDRLAKALKIKTMQFDFFSVPNLDGVELLPNPHLPEGMVWPYAQNGEALGVWVLPEEEVGA